MDTQVVLISGKQGSGKSSLAKGILKAVLHGAIDKCAMDEVSFAKPLYDLHSVILSYMANCGFDVPKKDGELLQWLGTEWGRSRFGQDVWVKLAKHDIKMKTVRDSLIYSRQVFVISDARFLNEVEGFPDAIKVRLECAEEIRKERILRTPGQNWRENTNHPSEIGLDEYRHWNCILNTDSLSPEECVDQVLRQLKGRFHA